MFESSILLAIFESLAKEKPVVEICLNEGMLFRLVQNSVYQMVQKYVLASTEQSMVS